MYSKRQRLGDLLVSRQLITSQQLEQALASQRERYAPLGQILIEQNFISEERLLQICAHQRGVSPWHLQNDPPTPEALRLVPATLCRSHCLLPVQLQGDKLILAMRDPGDLDSIDTVRNVCRLRVEPVLANEERLVQTIDTAFGASEKSSAMLSHLVSEAMTDFEDRQPRSSAKAQPVSEAQMRPVVGLVDQFLTDAVRLRASDIHIEPRKNRIEVRYRVDGQLQHVHEVPSKLLAPLVARIKIMAHLDVVEFRVPQDGRITFKVDGRSVDLRVSVLPTYHGQRVVLRILDQTIALRTLSDLGFSTHNLGLFQKMIHKPYGLLLVTGPTGSGKTTTLYAALNQLKQVANNIMTCEDPVEYDLDGINQSHVNEKVGLTFAAQLRAILRQDPDIVLVGEIRDRETAETAIRAALTGHLVLSTLHCNDAPSAIPRLTDMGIEPFLLSTALIGITAQRLLRVLCPHCKESYMPSAEEIEELGSALLTPRVALGRAVGCAQCQQTGYKGRMGVHEVFPTPLEVQRAIAAGEPLETVRRLASRYGYRPLAHDACQQLAAGQTSLSEVRRMIFFETTTVPEASEVQLKLA
jgi:type IV pilus assembly protein PilB